MGKIHKKYIIATIYNNSNHKHTNEVKRRGFYLNQFLEEVYWGLLRQDLQLYGLVQAWRT